MQQGDPQAKNNQQQWYFVSKIVLTYCENFFKISRTIVHSNRERSVHTISEQNYFQSFPGGFSDLILIPIQIGKK